MEFKDLQKLSVAELHKHLGEFQEKLRDVRFKASADQLKNVREIRVVRKTIARIKLLLTQPKTK